MDDRSIQLMRACNLGDFYSLDYQLNTEDILSKAHNYQDNWHHYNPRKPGNERYGLSLTSLDGEMTGVPDLDSLPEHNRIHGTDFHEMDFTKSTKYFDSLEDKDALNGIFEGHIGRSHILWLKSGGFFPPHRDSFYNPPRVFRIIALVSGSEKSYKFILDDKILRFEPGRLYFMNTCLAHSVFSFANDTRFLIMNIKISEFSVNQVIKNLFVF